MSQISTGVIESRNLILRRKSTAPKQDKFSVKMAALGWVSFNVSVVGSSADGQEWKYPQGTKAVCDQVIIHQMDTTWGAVPHTRKLALITSWACGLSEWTEMGFDVKWPQKYGEHFTPKTWTKENSTLTMSSLLPKSCSHSHCQPDVIRWRSTEQLLYSLHWNSVPKSL